MLPYIKSWLFDNAHFPSISEIVLKIYLPGCRATVLNGNERWNTSAKESRIWSVSSSDWFAVHLKMVDNSQKGERGRKEGAERERTCRIIALHAWIGQSHAWAKISNLSEVGPSFWTGPLFWEVSGFMLRIQHELLSQIVIVLPIFPCEESH